MKLNIKKFMMTEMGGELEETIKAWDQALEEKRRRELVIRITD